MVSLASRIESFYKYDPFIEMMDDGDDDDEDNAMMMINAYIVLGVLSILFNSYNGLFCYTPSSYMG